MNRNDKFFKELADSYTLQDGKRLIEENKKLSKVSFFKKHRMVKILSTAAIIVLIYNISLPDVVNEVPMDNTPIAQKPSEETLYTEKPVIETSLDVDFGRLTAMITDDYQIVNYEEDNGENIFYIINNNNSEIVLSISDENNIADYSNYKDIEINEYTAKIKANSDFAILAYVIENRTYTLTTKYTYEELVDLSSQII